MDIIKRLTDKGREILDSTPISVPVRIRKPLSDYDRFRNMVQVASLEAQNSGFESIEDSQDFDIEDEFDEFFSNHEDDEDQDALLELQQAYKKLPERFKKRKATPPKDKPDTVTEERPKPRERVVQRPQEAGETERDKDPE